MKKENKKKRRIKNRKRFKKIIYLDNGIVVLVFKKLIDIVRSWLPYSGGIRYWFPSMRDVEDGELMSIFLENLYKKKIFGYSNNRKKIIAIWYDESCTNENIVRLISHELGHLYWKRYKSPVSEQKKANTFEDVSKYTIDVLKEMKILKNIEKNWR